MWHVFLVLALVLVWIYFRAIFRGRRKGAHGRELLKVRLKQRRSARLGGAESWDERRDRMAIWEPPKHIRSDLLDASSRGENGPRKKVAAFCSHGGSNFAAIADASQRDEIALDVVVMIHNNAKAGAKKKAEVRGIPTEWVPCRRFRSDEAYGEHILGLLRRYDVDILALAGFMQMIPLNVIRAYENRITNIHPALLPFFGGKGFYGAKVHQAVYESGMKVSGPTVHLVDEQYDHGPILTQQAVSIADCKNPQEIADRVLVEEHRLYPLTLGLLAQGAFRFAEGKATLCIDP